MEEQFYTILTSSGKSKIANSNVLGSKLNLVKFQVGDGGGAYYNPTEDQTQLKNKVWEGNINSIRVDKDNPSWIVIEVVIPTNEGGFMIREAGIVDADGDLIAIGKYPETFKPHIDNGSSKDLFMRMILEISNTENVTLKVDPTVIMATKKDVEVLDNKLEKLEKDICEDKLNSFKTDAQTTKLDERAGGFVNIDSIQGHTMVNAFIPNDKTNPLELSHDNTLLFGADGTHNMKPNTTYSQIVIGWQPYLMQYVGYDGSNGIVNYKNSQVVVFTTPNVIPFKCLTPHVRANDFRDISFLKSQIKVMLLEGDWTNRIIPSYFEGIKSVGEGKNLLNVSQFIEDDNSETYKGCKILSYNKSTGSIVVKNTNLNQRRFIIAYVDVKPNTNYVLTYNGDNDVLFYVYPHKTWTDDYIVANYSNTTFNTGNNNKITVGFYIEKGTVTNIKKIQLEEGTKATSYEEFGNRIEILSANENLCPEFTIPFVIQSGVQNLSDFIPCNLPKSYYFACIDMNGNIASPNGTSGIELNLYDKDKTQIDHWTFSNNSTRYISNQSNYNLIKYIRISNPATNTINLSIKAVQISSNNFTKYIPYKQDKTEILSATPWREWDSTDINGVKTIGSGQITFNGKEDWVLEQTYANKLEFYTGVPNAKEGINPSICDKLKVAGVDDVIVDNSLSNIICVDGRFSVARIGIKKSDLVTPDVDGLKQKLSQNPVTICYELKDSAKTTENTNKTLDLRAYDNLIVNAGSIQPQVSYSYAKNTGERITSIEDTVENVRDRVNTLSSQSQLTPLNGWTLRGGDEGALVVYKLDNLVRVNFNLTGGDCTDNTTLFILPKEFRPNSTLAYPLFSQNNGFMFNDKPCELHVKEDGMCKIKLGGNQQPSNTRLYVDFSFNL